MEENKMYSTYAAACEAIVDRLMQPQRDYAHSPVGVHVAKSLENGKPHGVVKLLEGPKVTHFFFDERTPCRTRPTRCLCYLTVQSKKRVCIGLHGHEGPHESLEGYKWESTPQQVQWREYQQKRIHGEVGK